MVVPVVLQVLLLLSASSSGANKLDEMWLRQERVADSPLLDT